MVKPILVLHKASKCSAKGELEITRAIRVEAKRNMAPEEDREKNFRTGTITRTGTMVLKVIGLFPLYEVNGDQAKKQILEGGIL